MSKNNEILVRVKGVSKKFCRDLKKSLWYGLKDVASELLPIQNPKSKIQDSGNALRPGEFWANRDISFELRRGDCIGLIGRNGAGKTTLLKMLNGLIKPDTGNIEMHGRVGALIALGAGFNPILTGRENIYVNGSILGLSKEEIDGKIEDIIDFAEIPEFIDSPVQSYSSGMQVRLGFAVATALNPDILILDEVLAVGDIRFREKCLFRIYQLLADCAVIFVSHNSSQVERICDRALVLDKGNPMYLGGVNEALEFYEKLPINRGHDHCESIESLFPPLRSIDVSSRQESIVSGKSLTLHVCLHVDEPIFLNHFAVLIRSSSSISVAHVSQEIQPLALSGREEIEIEIPQVDLQHGQYVIDIALSSDQGKSAIARCIACAKFSVEFGSTTSCPYQPTTVLRRRSISSHV